MPLSKQAKALYEAALARKEIPSGRVPVEHVTSGTYGPYRTVPSWVRDRGYIQNRNGRAAYTESRMAPRDTYWAQRGRYQDLEDELAAAIESGRYERTTPSAHQYYRYYNDGDYPLGFVRRMPGRSIPGVEDREAAFYDDPSGYFYAGSGVNGGTKKTLTALGEREMEAIIDADLQEEYKQYLKQMYGGKIRGTEGIQYGVRAYDPHTHQPLVSRYYNLDDALAGLRRNRSDYGSAYLEEYLSEK